ncbi:MAG TPA: hypothetical protein VI669_12680 [Vicinamibacteria bacterium]
MATPQGTDRSQEAAQRFEEGRRRPDLDRRWSPEVEAAVLEIVARTGSPKRASEEVGVSVSTIHDHRRRDPEFRGRYAVAMDDAFTAVLGHAFTRSFDDVRPSDRLTEVLLRLRWPERLGSFLQVAGGGAGSGGLDPMVIARMPADDRTALIALLEKYQEVAGDVALETEADGAPLLV